MMPRPRIDGRRCGQVALASTLALLGLLAAMPLRPGGDAATAAEATLPFGPAMRAGPLPVRAGRPVTLVNVDPRVLHHPFARVGPLTLDAGDLSPGASGQIIFPTAGRFTVICAVHPHMRTDVAVQ